MNAGDADVSRLQRIQEAKDILHTMRQCRARLNRLDFNHAASHADIAVQLMKQAIAEQASAAESETATPSSHSPEQVPNNQD